MTLLVKDAQLGMVYQPVAVVRLVLVLVHNARNVVMIPLVQSVMVNIT